MLAHMLSTPFAFVVSMRLLWGMVMKGKNLERAVILGLLLSTGVYGTAWAAPTSIKIDDDTLYLTGTADVLLGNGTIYTDSENQSLTGEASDFKTIIVSTVPSGDRNRANSPWSFKLDIPDTDLIINVKGEYENCDGIHLGNHHDGLHLVANSYTANIDSPISDAINVSHDTGDGYIILNYLNADVKQGNGIRANASLEEYTNSITIKKDAIITISADASYSIVRPTAVWAGDSQRYGSIFGIEYGSETKGKGEVYLNGFTKLTLNGKGNYGIFAGKNGSITVNDLNIIAKETNSYGIAATNDNIIYGTSMDKSENRFGSTVTLNGDSNNIIMGKINDDGTVTETENSKAIYADSQYGVVKSGDNGIGNIDIIGDIEARNGGTITLDIKGNEQNYLQGDIIAYGTQSSKNASVNLTTNVALAYQGDALAANGGIVDVKLGNYSSWAGRADDYQDATNSEWLKNHTDNLDTKFSGRVTGNGTVKIDMGTESTWNVTGQSWVTDLKGNNSYIILDNDENGNGYALHLEKITGSNTFAMNISPENNGNMIYVKYGTDAQQNLVINNRDEVLQNMDVDDAVRFATVANAGMGFENGEFADMPVQTFGRSTRINDAGIFNVDFDIVYNGYGQDMQGDAADTEEDYNGDSFDKNKPGSDYVDIVYGGTDAQNIYIVRKSVTKENQSDAGKTIINMSRANYKNAIYMDRLNKRMGEMRYVNGEEEQGLWVRLRHDRIGQSGDFRSMNTMYEVGYDVKQPTDNGEHRIGMAIDYMRGSTTYDDIMGKGETKRYGLWLYDTWLGEKGHYVDYVAKWGHLSNDFDITAKTTGEKINGDYSNNVFSVSAEYGKKNDMGNNWYFEPQAQLQLARVTGADYVTTQGSKVNVDGINSLIGRAGFRIGRDMDENSTVYLKADLLHEFMGDQTVTAADATGTLREEFENKGTWYDIGVGFAAKMSKNSYAFMDFEKSFGNDNDETYQINAGMQWMF